MFSKFLELNIEDVIKGLAMAVFGAILPIIWSVISTGSFAFDWKAIGTAALTAALAYLNTQLFSNSKGMLFSKEK